MKSLVLSVFVLFVTIFPVLSQNKIEIEDGWKGLLPFKSTKADVDRVLGNGMKTTGVTELSRLYFKEKYDNNGYLYRDDNAVIGVDYAGPSCSENAPWFDRLDVPEGTVLRYQVDLKKPVPISKFTWDVTRFDLSWWNSEGGHMKEFIYHQWMTERSKTPNMAGTGYGIGFWGEVIQDYLFIKGFKYDQPFGEREKHPCKKIALTK